MVKASQSCEMDPIPVLIDKTYFATQAVKLKIPSRPSSSTASKDLCRTTSLQNDIRKKVEGFHRPIGYYFNQSKRILEKAAKRNIFCLDPIS